MYFLDASVGDYVNPATIAGVVAMMLAIGTYVRGSNEHKLSARKDALETLNEKVGLLEEAIKKCEEHREEDRKEKNSLLWSYYQANEELKRLKEQA